MFAQAEAQVPGRGHGAPERVWQLRHAEVAEALTHADEGQPGSGECTSALTCTSIWMHISSEAMGRNDQGLGCSAGCTVMWSAWALAAPSP